MYWYCGTYREHVKMGVSCPLRQNDPMILCELPTLCQRLMASIWFVIKLRMTGSRVNIDIRIGEIIQSRTVIFCPTHVANYQFRPQVSNAERRSIVKNTHVEAEPD